MQEEQSVAGIGGAAHSTVYADNVILNASRGHGFAAEKANHLKDVLTGHDAQIIGGNNLKNGADRLVDGIQIQTKYCASGAKSIRECFHDGQFRYFNRDGSPMQIEVPADQYEAAVEAMKSRIARGQVPGLADPTEASNIVRKGGFSYSQARNIAKFGTIESITYDTIQGVQVAGTAMGLSAAIAFAYSMWNGESLETSLRQACSTGLTIGGATWLSAILTAQLGRTGVEKSLRSTSDALVQNLSGKTSAWLANGFRAGQNPIYGAAAKSNIAKLLRGNIVSGVVTTLVLSSSDIAHLTRGQISKRQALKNVTTKAAGVAGGASGYALGASLGTAVLPGAGTIAGGLLGGLLTGSMTTSASKVILDKLAEDDAIKMMKIIEAELNRLALEYLLSPSEINQVIESLVTSNLPHKMRRMYASCYPDGYAIGFIEPRVMKIAGSRKTLSLPSSQQLVATCEDLMAVA